MGDRALLNSCLKSPSAPGHSNVSVLLQSSWESLFNFLAAKLHFSGPAVGLTCAVCHTHVHFIPKYDFYKKSHCFHAIAHGNTMFQKDSESF